MKSSLAVLAASVLRSLSLKELHRRFTKVHGLQRMMTASERTEEYFVAKGRSIIVSLRTSLRIACVRGDRMIPNVRIHVLEPSRTRCSRCSSSCKGSLWSFLDPEMFPTRETLAERASLVLLIQT